MSKPHPAAGLRLGGAGLMIERFLRGVPLKDYTTFKIGGAARYFFTARTKQDLIEALKWARQENVPFFVLGGGSNLLVSDNGFDGLVIKVQGSKFKVQSCNSDFEVCVAAEAGVWLGQLLKTCLVQGLTGLEWASGIPGITVGGAIRNAAGGFGQKIAGIVSEVEVFDASALESKKLATGGCRFDYKQSIFKENSNLVILSAVLGLKKHPRKEIELEIVRVLNYRRQRHPAMPSAGCIFKNPDDETPAAMLIDKAGLKGERRGQAEISEKHANFVVNLGGAGSGDVLELIKLAKAKVKEKFKIELEEEIQYLGF